MRKIPVLTQHEYEIATHRVDKRVLSVDNTDIFHDLGYATRMAGNYPK